MGKRNTTIKPLPFNEADVVTYMKANAIVLTTGPLTDAFVTTLAAKLTAKAKPAKAHVEFLKSVLEGMQAVAEVEAEKQHKEAVLLPTEAGLFHVEHSEEPTEMEGQEEAEEDEDGEGKAPRSIVPLKHRQIYKERGDATCCGDHVAKFLKRATLDAKGGSRVEILKNILAQNGVSFGRWEHQIAAGKMGQFRMNSGNELRRKIAADGFFLVPRSVFVFLDAANVKYNDVVDGLFFFDGEGNARLELDSEFRNKWMTAKDKKALAEANKQMAEAMADAE